MKLLYWECAMGAAGDMLCASLLELFPNREEIVGELNALGMPHAAIAALPMERQGIQGTRFAVSIDGEEETSQDLDLRAKEPPIHPHSHIHSHGCEQNHPHGHGHPHPHGSPVEIRQVIEALQAPEEVQKNAQAVFSLLAQAESSAHGRPVDQIHFHEVGTLDAVADIVACAYLLYRLAPDWIVASPVHVGSGHVHCAHGILPVPAPATAYLLRGIPIYAGSIRGELCTPTGAALLKYFVQDFRELPLMTIAQIGYGMGTKDFGALSCVRAFWGEDAGHGEIKSAAR